MSLDLVLDFGNLKDNFIEVMKKNDRSIKIKNKNYIIDFASYATNPLADFLITFKGSLDGDATVKAMKKLNGICENKYGLIFNANLELLAVFNTAFGDYNGSKVVYRKPEEILNGYKNNITGKAELDLTGLIDYPDFGLLNGRGNLLPVFKNVLAEHKVSLGSKEFSLVKAYYISNTGNDFVKTFKNLDEEILSRAKIVFDVKEANAYGLLYNNKPEAEFIFNKSFCDYDFNEHILKWKQPKELLLEQARKILEELDPKKALNDKFDKCELKVNNLVKEKIVDEQLPKVDWELEELNRVKERMRRATQLPPVGYDPYRCMGGHAIMYAAPIPSLREE